MSLMQMLFGGAPAATTPNVPPQAGTPPVATPPTGTPNTPQLPGTQANQVTAPNGVVPAGSNVDPATQTPMDQFKDLWQTPPTEDPNANQSMFANLDPKKVMDSAKTVDFTKALTPEVLQKIQAGGAEAMQILPQVLNSVAQASFGQSTLTTSKIVEQALAKQQEKFEAMLPTLVKRASADDALSANPIYSNPAIQPLVTAAKEMFVRKHPNATAAEITSQVESYFKALGQSLAPAPAQPASKTSPGEVDWDKFMAS